MMSMATNTTPVRGKTTEKGTAGSFAPQRQTAPEVTLAPATGPTPKQLGMIGAGPASSNSYSEPADRAETEDGIPNRPLRPYLALSPADDDEFFDAPVGSHVHVTTKDGERYFTLEQFAGKEDPVWAEHRAGSSHPICELERGEMWAELFADDGRMHSNRLHAPEGYLYSDRTHFVHRSRVDERMLPLTIESLVNRRGQLTVVSRSSFGDQRQDGVDPMYEGQLSARVEGGKLIYGRGNGAAPSRSIALGKVQTFWRNGLIVVRSEQDEGYGWEEAYDVSR